jgi:hypothetical protein
MFMHKNYVTLITNKKSVRMDIVPEHKCHLPVPLVRSQYSRCPIHDVDTLLVVVL